MVSARASVALLALVLAAACGPLSGAGGRGPLEAGGRLAPGGWILDRGAFSPDGRRVAFVGVDPDGNQRAGVAADGGSVEAVTPEDWTVVDFAWMPGSESLLVVRHGERGDTLAIVGVDGEVVRMVDVDRPFGAGRGMVVSPDGDYAIVSMQEPVALERPADLVRLDLATGATTNLTRTPRLTEDYPSWAGRDRLVFTSGHLVVDVLEPNGAVEVVDLDGGDRRRLTPRDHVAGAATASPDGSTVVYSAFVGGDRRTQALWAVPTDGGEPRRVSAVSAHYPSYAPDGERVLVALVGGVGADGGLGLVQVARPDGTAARG
ncbi:MAG TPA: hypothetical protein VHJ34_00235 [Actinomycetota bacterium]|nr:hypothetical protein [Actinomycetota bacterium]